MRAVGKEVGVWKLKFPAAREEGRAAGCAEVRRGSEESWATPLILSLSRPSKEENTGGRSPAGLVAEPQGSWMLGLKDEEGDCGLVHIIAGQV
jgi:hypothetical protein